MCSGWETVASPPVGAHDGAGGDGPGVWGGGPRPVSGGSLRGRERGADPGATRKCRDAGGGAATRSVTGTYILILRLESGVETEVGGLGLRRFPAGYYSYTGSAMGGLLPRVRRHLASRKVLHWHIDYLLRHVRVVRVILIPSRSRSECRVHGRLRRGLEHEVPVPRFGSTDCRCPSHLLRYRGDPTAPLRDLLRAPDVDWNLHRGKGTGGNDER